MRLFKQAGPPPFRIFFATDVHGSDRCFRKFLAAAEIYNADALILGGDVAGKAIVPIVARGDSEFSYSFQGVTTTVARDDLAEIEAVMNFNGFYPRVTEQAEVDRMAADPAFLVRIFEETIQEQVAGWCDLAAERLADDIACIITPGNDDPRAIDGVLAAAPRVDCPELATVELGPVFLASLGNTNRTPWDTDREFEEDQLAEQIRTMVEGFADRPLVFNFHCPPYDTGLDLAMKLDDDFRPVLSRGNPVEIPVGSTAVREAIEAFEPVVGLHGHIHESAKAAKLGPTWIFNPGSEYGSGVLRGLIVDLEEDGQVRDHLFTHG